MKRHFRCNIYALWTASLKNAPNNHTSTELQKPVIQISGAAEQQQESLFETPGEGA